MKILYVFSDLGDKYSVFTRRSERFVSWVKSKYENAIVLSRDLHDSNLPRTEKGCLEDQIAFGINDFSEPNIGTNLSKILIDEVLQADIIIISSAIVDNKVSYLLKDWIFQLFHRGVTFRETEYGIEGLLKGKKVFLIEPSYGVYRNNFLATINFQELYIKAFFGFLGIRDIQVIRAEQLVDLNESSKIVL